MCVCVRVYVCVRVCVCDKTLQDMIRLAFIIQEVNALFVVVAEVKKISFQRIVAW